MANYDQQNQHVQGTQNNVGHDQHNNNVKGHQYHIYYPTPSTQANSPNSQVRATPEPITVSDWIAIIGKGIGTAVVSAIVIFFGLQFLFAMLDQQNRITWVIIIGFAPLLGIVFGISAGKKKLRQIRTLREKGKCIKCEGRGKVKCPGFPGAVCIGGSVGSGRNRQTCSTCHGNGSITCPKCLGTQLA